ncbi:MAG: hypothetical protein ABEI53_00735 [Candidatus Magasanikbacteria bacterium]
MRKFFNGIRWFIASLLLILTFLLIVANSVFTSASLTITNPENPKGWLKKGDVYEKVVSVSVDKAIEKARKKSAENSPFQKLLTKKEIKRVGNKIFTPEWIEGEVEPLIDSAYAFLNKKEKLNFKIDLSLINKRAEKELTKFIDNKIKTIPQCGPRQKSGCLPASLNRKIMEKILKQRLEQGLIPKGKVIITEKDVNIEPKKLEKAQWFFSLTKKLPWLFFLGLLGLSILIALFIPNKNKKLKVPGYLWILSGLSSIGVSSFGENYLSKKISNFASQKIPANEKEIIELLEAPLKLALNDVTTYLIYIGIFLILAGMILVFISRQGNSLKK